MMRTYIITVLVLVLIQISSCLHRIYAQTQTPFGTPIDGFTQPEANASNLALWESQGEAWVRAHGNSQVTKTGSATQTYNCHSFAWHISEGGSAMWINAFTDMDLWMFDDENPTTVPPSPTQYFQLLE